VAEHERIIQAITDGDPEAAARSMREHILSVQAQQLALSDLS
jgi:DNA-binding GntR family transcriptional regulator